MKPILQKAILVNNSELNAQKKIELNISYKVFSAIL